MGWKHSSILKEIKEIAELKRDWFCNLEGEKEVDNSPAKQGAHREIMFLGILI